MIRLAIAPIVFFRSRLEGPPRWGQAIAIVSLFVALSTGVALVTVHRVHAELAPAFEAAGVPVRAGAGRDLATVLITVISLLPMPGLMAASAVMLDVLFSQSGRGPRLVEFTWLAYAVHLPWVAIVALTMLWVPYPELSVGAALPIDVTALSVRYQQQLADDAVLSSMHLVGMSFTLWVAAVQACALRVVSGFTVGGAWAAGLALAAMFAIAPALI